MCAESRVQSPSSALLCVDWAGRSVANPRTVIQSSVIAVASWCPNRKETELRRYRFNPRTHRLRCFVFFLFTLPLGARCQRRVFWLWCLYSPRTPNILTATENLGPLDSRVVSSISSDGKAKQQRKIAGVLEFFARENARVSA